MHNNYLAALEEQRVLDAELGKPELKRAVLYRGAMNISTEIHITEQKNMELLKRTDISAQKKQPDAKNPQVSEETKTRRRVP